MKVIYRLHWDGWTRDIVRPEDAPPFAGSTYFLHLIEPPTGLVAEDLRMMVSPPMWRFNLESHETIKADGMDETHIVHYIADEPPWRTWEHYHEKQARLVTLDEVRAQSEQQ